MLAIAAMSRNGVIGNGSSIPWRIPDEQRWFRRMTLGGVLVMGRRTFESLPKPLDGRVTVVLTRDPLRLLEHGDPGERYRGAVVHSGDGTQLPLPRTSVAQVVLASDIDSLARPEVKTWLCGGAQLYEQFLDRCTDLYLSVVSRDVEGDVRFPPFEHLFELDRVVEELPEVRVHHYVRNSVAGTASPGLPP